MLPLQNGTIGLKPNTHLLELKRKNQLNPNLVIIKSSDIINMLDADSIEYLTQKELQSLCIMASIDLQLQLEDESTSNRRNLC